MLSLLRREARRLPGIRSLVPQVIDSVVDISQPSRNSRLFSTSCLVDGGSQQHQSTETLAVLGAWHAAGNWEPWLWRREEQREGVFAAKVSEVLGGVGQAATGLLQQWGLPLAVFETLPYVFAGVELGLLRQPLDQEEELCGEEDGGGSELFGGVWQTSVKRKRVMKMRKHKWRKRRRALRQSAARRVNK